MKPRAAPLGSREKTSSSLNTSRSRTTRRLSWVSTTKKLRRDSAFAEVRRAKLHESGSPRGTKAGAWRVLVRNLDEVAPVDIGIALLLAIREAEGSERRHCGTVHRFGSRWHRFFTGSARHHQGAGSTAHWREGCYISMREPRDKKAIGRGREETP